MEEQLNIIQNLVKNKKKFIFIGGAGSGKTEIATNFAINLSRDQDLPVHFFDVDQTKSAFRARDIKKDMIESGVIFHQPVEFLDSMVVPHGLKETLLDTETYSIIDAGGNEKGSRMLAHLEEHIKSENAIVFLVINCYRPFFDSEIAATSEIKSITEALGETEFRVIANPNFGTVTNAIDVIEGLKITYELLGLYKDRVSILTYNNKIEIKKEDFSSLNIIGIDLFQRKYI